MSVWARTPRNSGGGPVGHSWSGARPRDPLPCGLAMEDALSGLSTPQPPPGLTGLVAMGPQRVPEVLG